MTKQIINIGTSANKGNGDPLRTAFTKVNANFDDLYAAIGTGITAGATAPVGPIVGDLWYDTNSGRTYIYYDSSWIDSNPPTTSVISSLVNGTKTVSLGTDGSLSIPGDIKSNGNINININLIDSTMRRWQFGEDGLLTFPDGTNQSTAWTGSVAYSSVTGTPTIPSAYTLPTASASVLGGIKIGTGLSIDVNGVVTASSGSVSSLVNGAKTVSLGTDSILTLPAPLAQLINASQLATDTAKIYRATNSTDLAAIATAWETWYESEQMFRELVYQDSVTNPNRPWANKPSWEAYPIITAYMPTGSQLPIPSNLPPTAKEAHDNYLAYKQLVSSIDIVNGNKTISFDNAGLLSLPGKLEFKDTANAKIILKTIDPFGYVVEDSELDKTWTFNANGSLTFPNNTTQTTAWTGSVAYSSVTGTPTIPSIGNVGFRNDSIYDLAGLVIDNSNTSTASTAGITIPANGSGTLSITNSSNYWAFGPDGTTTFPSNSIKNSLDNSTAITTQRTLTANNSYTNVTDFSTDVDLGSGMGVIAGWYQRTLTQIEFALFGPSAFISYLTGLALGRTVIVTYNTASGTSTLTRTLTQVFASTGQTDPNNPSWGRVSGRIDATLPVGQLGIISINFPVYSTSTNNWTFGANGNTTFPTGLVLGAPRGPNTVNFTTAIDKSFQIETGTSTTSKLWSFGTTGALTFPDTTSQTTAWTGSVSSLVNGAHELELVVNGATPYVTFPAVAGGYVFIQGSEISVDGSGAASLATLSSAESDVRLSANVTGAGPGRKDWTFGPDGALTFPNGTLKITDSVISNLNVVGDLSTGSQIQVGSGVAADTGIIISNSVTNSLGEEGPALESGSLVNVNGSSAYMAFKTVNSLGGGDALTGEEMVEVSSSGVRIGVRVTNDLGDSSPPLVAFQGWTFDNGELALPIGTVISETPSEHGLYRTKYSGNFVLDPTWFAANTGNIVNGDSFPEGILQNYDEVSGAFSFQYFGYFVPPTTANYTFRAHADETFVFWIGSKALSGYTYANKDMYGNYNGTFPEQQTQSFTIALTAGEFYPIRIQWANGGGFGELDVFTWANDVGQADTADFTGRVFRENTGTAKIAVNDNRSIILSTDNTTDNNWTFAPNGALTLPNSAVIRQSTNTEVTSAFVAYTAAIASWEYTRINDYLYSINNNPNLSLAGWAFAGWNDVSGTTASAYLAILSNAMIIQNSAPSSPPTPLVFTPALSASLAVQIGSGLQLVISTYAAWQALLTSVDIVAGKERLSLLSNNKIQIPGIIQTDVEEDIIIRTRSAGVTSPAGSGALSYANKDFIFGTNGALTFEKYANATIGNAVIQGDSSGNLNLTGGNYVNIESWPYAAVKIARDTANTSVDMGNATSPVRAFGNLQIMSGGTLTFADSTVQSTAYVKTTGTWTVTTGTNNYSFTVPANGAYQLWVRGNIPNGIISYIATVHVTNPNVPVLGTQRAWNYTGAGDPILLTSIPSQIIGTEGTISTGAISSTTNNVFVFGISNTSGSNQTVSWGYVTL